MPSSLVSDHIVTTSGDAFAVSGLNGDIVLASVEGFYSADTRFLSESRVRIGRRTPAHIGSAAVARDVASFYSSTDASHSGKRGGVSVVRDRYVAGGMHEDLAIFNHSSRVRSLTVTLSFDADFADVFEVRRRAFRKAGRVTVEPIEGGLRFVYLRERFRRETLITFSQAPVVDGRRASFHVRLEPRSGWKVCVSILPVTERVPMPTPCVAEVIGEAFGPRARQPEPSGHSASRTRTNGTLADVPAVETAHPVLRAAYDRAVEDLRSLVIEHDDGEVTLAAGLPWFMAIFGRDSIIAALQTKMLGPELMTGTLKTLAAYQATEPDPFREAEPGKIPHEVRQGELSVFEEVPHSRYYGSVDSTPLFLILLAETYRWTGDQELVRQMLPAAEDALRWIDMFGDPDGDGFVEYPASSPHGLRNQCWKDSEDSISFAGGRLASGPLAVAEVQGYVYAAKMGAADLYRMLGNPVRADVLQREAEALRKQFDEAFWMPEEGCYAIALDGQKRRVDSVASNAGHCLWTGIAYPERAAQVAERMMAPDMFSGWGVRTLSSEMARYDPVSYHNGSVWPHDNSLIAAGLARYGHHEAAEMIVDGLMAAAAAFPENRLPELFAGYTRRGISFPVPYPSANAPQAWAAGAIIYGLELLLRLKPDGDSLVSETPSIAKPLTIHGVKFRGGRWDF